MWNCVCQMLCYINMFAQLMKHTTITVTKGAVSSYLSNTRKSNYQLRVTISLCREKHDLIN